MELYYKDLISEDASLEKLVDDLAHVVQGADELAKAAGAQIDPRQQSQVTSILTRLKDRYQRLNEGALAGARAADRVVRRNPYQLAGLAFAAGLLCGVLWRRRS